jgi:hypothetical protein
MWTDSLGNRRHEDEDYDSEPLLSVPLPLSRYEIAHGVRSPYDTKRYKSPKQEEN